MVASSPGTQAGTTIGNPGNLPATGFAALEPSLPLRGVGDKTVP